MKDFGEKKQTLCNRHSVCFRFRRLMEFLVISAHMGEDIMAHLVIEFHDLSTRRTKIFVSAGDVVVSLALFAPDPDVASATRFFGHDINLFVAHTLPPC